MKLQLSQVAQWGENEVHKRYKETKQERLEASERRPVSQRERDGGEKASSVRERR